MPRRSVTDGYWRVVANLFEGKFNNRNTMRCTWGIWGFYVDTVATNRQGNVEVTWHLSLTSYCSYLLHRKFKLNLPVQQQIWSLGLPGWPHRFPQEADWRVWSQLWSNCLNTTTQQKPPPGRSSRRDPTGWLLCPADQNTPVLRTSSEKTRGKPEFLHIITSSIQTERFHLEPDKMAASMDVTYLEHAERFVKRYGHRHLRQVFADIPSEQIP